jgi:N-acetyl sugar amidotransferase
MKPMSKCNRCILDETVPELSIGSNGWCQYCDIYDNLSENYPIGAEGSVQLQKILDKIKSGKNKEFNCVVGVSGGVDSTYTLLQAKKLGLKPLAVHCDTGWNTKEAVMNIRSACSKLNVELYTLVVDWEEFKDLQRSFLLASTPDADIPADMAILATLFKVASKKGIKYILNGHSFRTEGVSPVGWTYYDGLYIKSVQKKFGTMRLKKFPNFTMVDYVYHIIIRKRKLIQFLNYFDYSKDAAKLELIKELDWKDPGGHHHENGFTHFFQSYYLPKKFNIDKRKTKLSAQVLSGKITRDNAVHQIESSTYPIKIDVVNYAQKKLQFSGEEFEQIMRNKPKSFLDYKTNANFISKVWFVIEVMYKLGIIQELIYHKYKMLTRILAEKKAN